MKGEEKMYGCEETLCTTCSHREVCSKKEDYLSAVKAVKGIMVSLGDRKAIYLKDMNWIRPVRLECIHYDVPTLEVRG